MDEVITIRESFPVEKGDFVRAGEASSKIKRLLRQLGIDSSTMRRVAIAAYEAELNLVIHSDGGTLEIELTPDKMKLMSRDHGPGIKDIDLAMCEGYSTASEDIRLLGFGAGMGLPNMRRNCNDFHIESELGKGTLITMVFDLG